MAVSYWLVKSEPLSFSFEDLKNSKGQTTHWDGVRNYQARNFLKSMKKGDKVLFYHSNADPLAVYGVCEVVKEAYPDFTAFDPDDKHYDPKSSKDEPTWFMVDLKFSKEFKRPVTVDEMKNNKALQNMQLLKRGNRLSVMPVTKEEFEVITELAKKQN